jgi:sec-independent protein translocase protein TatA
MPRIGPMELIIVLFIVLVIFGAGRLPEIGGALGKGIREFRKGSSKDNIENNEETGADSSVVATKHKKKTS